MKRIFSAFVLSVALLVLPAMGLAVPGQAAAQSQQAGVPSIKVWVNTSSRVYHCPGTRWYGATKHGEYMTQKQAQDAGNRPAYGKPCN